MILTTAANVSTTRRGISYAEAIDAPQDLFSDKTTKIVSWVMYALCEIIAVFGTGANILNIICFVKLDLRDAINVSFLGLSISDLGSLVTLIWASLCMSPLFIEIDAPFDPVDLQSLVSGWPHVAFTRITSWITALITLERCLCITMPLKVRNILTPKRVIIVITCIVILSIAAISPIYYSSRLAWVFSPERNRTILTAVFSSNRVAFEQIAHGISNVFSPFAAYVAVMTFTIVLVVKLRQKTKWRLTHAANGKADASSERDQKVAKMVVMISAIFIACFIPLSVIFIAMILEPRIAVGGEYENVIVVFGGMVLLTEGTNSAMNIFIYYRMSSKYRVIFQELFIRRKT